MIEEGTGYYAVPCSVKAVVISDDQVLLGLNDRGEWELPGGWPDKTDTTVADTAIREVHEETGLHLDADTFTLVGAELFAPVPGRQVALVCLSTTVDRDLVPHRSAEHREVTWHPAAKLPQNLPEIYRGFIATGVDVETRQV
ncbi:MAG TPA: NUDIX hydrolase [Candidatus Corynebacterium avicola]|uniref:NUDIX hydrolase n=1 Tax=Candidatus Corynebacterium avicola TaxID=2838527 RepID=A0A9D1RLH3_9CORY|nr:NUDIX hydrolase [Candidatus Corynebacterium avicola]